MEEFSGDSSSCSKIGALPYMHLDHITGFSSKALKFYSSKSAIDKTAYGDKKKLFWS